jgi:hypothetical protein
VWYNQQSNVHEHYHQEGFTQLEDLGVLKTNTDVNNMAKRMATRTQGEGRVLLGMVMIQQLQTLVWWVRDQHKHGLTISAVDFDAAAMNQASEMKTLQRKWAEKDPSVTALEMSNPDDFDLHEDAFLNLLAQSFGVLREPLHYIVRPEATPPDFTTTEEEQMYQFLLTGGSFELDNQKVYCKLKAFLINSQGWAWIKPNNSAENGMAAYMA